MSCSVHGQLGSCAQLASPHWRDWLPHALRHANICVKPATSGTICCDAFVFIGAGVGIGVGCAVMNVTVSSDKMMVVVLILICDVLQITAAVEAMHW